MGSGRGRRLLWYEDALGHLCDRIQADSGAEVHRVPPQRRRPLQFEVRYEAAAQLVPLALRDASPSSRRAGRRSASPSELAAAVRLIAGPCR
jgi:hypothetical protein